MSAFFVSFFIILVAELGDKSQLVALWFATRYRWWLVILGVTCATLVVHLGSVAAGTAIAGLLPEWLTFLVVGLSFFGFAFWTLREINAEGVEKPAATARLGAFGLITSGFFISELGDKTQLATISLAGNQEGFVAVWLGSTLGMVAADALAIGAGVVAGRKLPKRAIALGAALLFAVFGALAVLRALQLQLA